MTEKHKNIDQLFKEKLSERSFDVPKEYVTNLESMLPAAVNYSKIFWWVGLSVLVVGFILGICFWPSSSVDQQYNGAQLFMSIDSISNRNGSEINDGISAFNSSKTKLLIDDVKDFTSSANVQNLLDNDIDNGVPSKIEAKEIVQAYVKGEKSVKKPNSGSASIKLKSVESGKKISDSKGQNKEEVELTKNTINENGVKEIVNSTSDSIDINEPFIVVNTHEDSIVIRDSVVIRDSIVVRDSVVIRDTIVIRDSVRIIDNPHSNYELKMFGGLSTVSSKIVSATPVYEILDEKIISPEFGLVVNYVKNNIHVGMGVSYYQYGEKTKYPILTEYMYDSTYVDYYNDTIVQDSMTGNWDTISTPVYDSVEVSKVNNEHVTSENYYDKISIPLNFGYRFAYKSWVFIPQAGLNLEIGIGKRLPMYPNSDYSASKTAIVRKITVAYHVQMEVRKDFGNWFIYGSPFYRSTISNLIESNDLNRKYQSFGGVFGLGVKF